MIGRSDTQPPCEIIRADDRDATRKAVAALAAGELVGLPTETVYGLAADARNDEAVARIFVAKGRPSFNPLIVHVCDAAMARQLVEVSPLAERLIAAFWPGPLTIVALKRTGPAVSAIAAAGLDTLAVRAPSHSTARAVIGGLGRPIVAPSANPSGGLSPTRAGHVATGFAGRNGPSLILDAGPCPIGVESTIVRVDGDCATLLRPGGVPIDAIEAVIGGALRPAPARASPDSPGQLISHYAPVCLVRLNAAAPSATEAYLGFGSQPERPFAENLSPAGDLDEAASNLFELLWRLDAVVTANGLGGIAVAPIPLFGLGAAINDRLARAAAPRPAGEPDVSSDDAAPSTQRP